MQLQKLTLSFQSKADSSYAIRKPKECQSNADCKRHECCARERDPGIVSKRKKRLTDARFAPIKLKSNNLNTIVQYTKIVHTYLIIRTAPAYSNTLDMFQLIFVVFLTPITRWFRVFVSEYYSDPALFKYYGSSESSTFLLFNFKLPF